MTDVEEALLWAREQLATFWEKAPGVRDADRAVHINNARSGASDGDLEEAVTGRLHWLDGNRAGAAASAERIKELERGLIGTCASLAAAISLLERGGRKAAASDKMFETMLEDYRAGLSSARALLKETDQ